MKIYQNHGFLAYQSPWRQFPRVWVADSFEETIANPDNEMEPTLDVIAWKEFACSLGTALGIDIYTRSDYPRWDNHNDTMNSMHQWEFCMKLFSELTPDMQGVMIL